MIVLSSTSCKHCKFASFCKFYDCPDTAPEYFCYDVETGHEKITLLLVQYIETCIAKGIALDGWVFEFWKARQYTGGQSLGIFDDGDLIDELRKRYPESKVWTVAEGEHLDIDADGPCTVLAL